MKMMLRLTEDFGLIPFEDDAIKYVYNRKAGDILECTLIQQRNYAFHKKLFALFKAVHDAFPDPAPIEFMGRLLHPEKNFDMTRKWLTVQAGYYDVLVTPKGDIRVEAKSLKFNSMKQDDFDKLYSSVIDASLKALPRSWTEDELERVAQEIINFV